MGSNRGGGGTGKDSSSRLKQTERKGTRLSVWQAWLASPSLPHMSWVALGKFLNLPGTWFPCCKMGTVI